jgi:pimeloyl-ACP methyl ester carboxylesterase
VEVDVAGREDGQPIVLLHGIGVTRKQWLPQMRDLVDEFRLIARDLPGHGTLKERRFTLDAAATHAAAVIDAYADGRALVVGLSLGEYVAMRLAARSPEKVAGLVLTGCSGNPKGVLGVIPASMALFWRAMGGRWLKLVNEVHFRTRYGDELAKQQIEAGFFFQAMQDALRQLRGKDFPRELKRYPGPVLLLNGEKDSLYRLSELLFLAAAQDARLQFVRGAGHVANLEQPEAYNKAVRTFARSVEW